MTFGKTGFALALTALTTAAGGLYAGYSLADQPRMHSALEHLQMAENDLSAADNDKGGHRQRALELTRKAIAQVHDGMRYDRRN
jgi:hypothetical protein